MVSKNSKKYLNFVDKEKDTFNNRDNSNIEIVNGINNENSYLISTTSNNQANNYN